MMAATRRTRGERARLLTRRQAALRAVRELEELARTLKAVRKPAERVAALRIAEDLRGADR
jgi:hypothetical protein